MIEIKTYKKIFGLILVLTLSIFITGCGAKEKTSATDIKKEMKKEGYIVEEASLESVGVKNAKTAYVFIEKKFKYQIEYYEFKEEKDAKKKYNIIYSLYESYGDDKQSDNSSSGENNERYEITTSDKYSVVSRIDNSVLYVSAPIKYKSEVEDVLDNINY